MAEYATRLANSQDTIDRMRRTDALGLTPSGNPTLARSGLRPDGGGAVSVNSGQMSVTVTAFAAWIDGSFSDAQVGYPVFLDANKTLSIAAGHATLVRIDTIVAQVRDNAYDGSGSTDLRVLVVQGVPGAGAPTLPATAIPLRDISVHAGASAGTGGLTGANLSTDRRQYVTSLGGILPVSTTTERNALGLQPGGAVYRKDTNNTVDVWDGTNWRPIWLNPPAAKVSQSASQSIPDNVITNVTWDASADYAKGGMVAGAGGITIPVAGVYRITGSVAINYTGPAGFFMGIISVNGSNVRGLFRSSGWSSTQPSLHAGTDTMTLAAGDVVTLGAFQNSGAARSTGGSTIYQTRLSVEWVSP